MVMVLKNMVKKNGVATIWLHKLKYLYIRPNSYKNVLCDQWLFSNLVHTGFKLYS